MYSQKDEEAHILRLVGNRVGRFLDIGAYDGYNYSNTMALVERGWEGIMVEPGLEAFQALLKRHGGNPKLTLVHAAIGPHVLGQFWNNPTTFSTTEQSNTKKFGGERFEEFWVPNVPIEALLYRFPGPIDVLSIDTEGTSANLFTAFPFGYWHPQVVCVEHDAWWNSEWDMGRFNILEDFAESKGYHREYSNEENVIFARNRP